MKKAKPIPLTSKPLSATTKPLKRGKPLKTSPSSKKRPKSSITKLKAEADKFFSQATRLRFADEDGLVQCVTCPNKKPWKAMQNGHFMSRRFNSTRFEEQNTAPQCYGCNVMHQGRQYEFGLALDAWYGAGTAQAMHKLSQEPHQFNEEELRQIIHDSKEVVTFYERTA